MIVYRITNKINGSMYIGQTYRELGLRKSEHKYDASTGLNYPLYNAMNKYGFDNFVFEVVATAETVEELNDLEQYYIEHFNTLKPNGYNLGRGGQNKKMTEETKKKMSVAHTGKVLTEEHRKNSILAHTGMKRTEESKKRMSDAQMGKKNHMFGKVGALNPNFGSKRTEEAKKRMSESKKGKKNPKMGLANRKTILCLNNDRIYRSATEAAMDLFISKSGISQVANGICKQMKGYRFKFI